MLFARNSANRPARRYVKQTGFKQAILPVSRQASWRWFATSSQAILDVRSHYCWARRNPCHLRRLRL
jgi:hypothetical protein